MRELTLLSLFDGSGGFPLAASMCGIRPVACSEVEPYPIAVTRSRFPNMEHLGSVTEVKGNEVEPVDIVSFGAPCQDLSVAGKRAGLRHEGLGDEETTRSGLFMEAVRIIKEMREATNGEYPRYAIYENVPGAFSSSKGEDWRIVLEELIKIVEPTAVMPEVPKNGWPCADVYCGDGWSLAYRVLDAQYWGVPQRRRRIYLVADFRGQRAGKISFEREGLRGYFTEGRTPWQATAGDAESSVGTADCELIPYTLKIRSGVAVDSAGKAAGKGALIQTNMSATLGVSQDQYLFQPVTLEPGIAAREGGHIYDGVCGTLRANAGDNQMAVAYAETYQKTTGPLMANSHPGSYSGQDAYNDMFVVGKEKQPIALDRAFFNQGANAQYDPQLYTDGAVTAPLQARDYKGGKLVRVRYIVRRLTPTECARLQGFPDTWGHPDIKSELTDDEYAFWLNVRNTHAEINGKATKEYTKAQMLTWYNKLHTDSSEYKMWGNGIALPCALYVMQGIAEVSNEN